MNTPRPLREFLLARHASARPALDAQRDALLARFAASAPLVRATPFSPFACFAVLHRELYAPYRRAWTALACVWLAILSGQQLERLTTPPFASVPIAASDAESQTRLLALWLEQRRLLAALTNDPRENPAAPLRREMVAPPATARPLGAIIESAPSCLFLA